MCDIMELHKVQQCSVEINGFIHGICGIISQSLTLIMQSLRYDRVVQEVEKHFVQDPSMEQIGMIVKMVVGRMIRFGDDENRLGTMVDGH